MTGRRAMPLLRLSHLCVSFRTAAGLVPAVADAAFDIARGRTLGLVGPSGSGKTVTCHALLDLLPANALRVSGRALFDGRDLFALGEAAAARLRGGRIAMIFQNPTQSLNPVLRIERQVCETLRLHRGLTGRAASREAAALLEAVGISDARLRLAAYPHELSGGMCQRVMIAMAIAARPDLIIADEPTTALDLTTQAQILHLLRGLQRDFGTALLLVTHDTGVIAEMAHDVVVMDAGRVVERGAVGDVFARPRHPVTRTIIAEAARLPAAPALAPPPLLAEGAAEGAT